MIRVRNDFGGFWGSGVTFDLRQLWIRGVIADKVRFQLGDIDYRMSPYTFRNEDEWILGGTSTMSETPLDMVRYDLFQNNNETWRQQGVALDFGFQLKRYIDKINLSTFATRVAASDFGAPFDRIFGGGMLDMQVMKNWHLRYHYANLFDLSQTSSATVSLTNPVQSAALKWAKPIKNWNVHAEMEAGRSTMQWDGDPDAPLLEDGFADIGAGIEHKPSRIKVKVNYREVGANFRSPGAQTKRIRFGSAPIAYQRYGNAQTLRTISSYDLLRDASLYNTQLTQGLMDFDPRYGNALPYGTATPNRRGVTTNLGWTSKDNALNADASFAMLNDIAGQGTDELRSFQIMRVRANVLLHEYFGLKRKLTLGGMLNLESTSRGGDPTFETADLKNQMMNFSFEWEFWDDLSLLGEWRNYTSQGHDQLAIRDDYSQVVDFVAVEFDGTETLLGGGIQYAVNEKIFAQLFYQQFSWEDRVTGQLPYDWSNWQFNFVMTL
jgi:opacity protein-like surface antigen